MGMSFGDGPDFDAIKKEREAAKKGKKKVEKEIKHEPVKFLSLGVIDLNGERVKLVMNTDTKRFYKAKLVRSYREDQRNRTPIIDVYSDEIPPFTDNLEPFTEEDQKYWDQK